jgi:16S rRNA (cytidine1402-2'-O)-methyltransferase
VSDSFLSPFSVTLPGLSLQRPSPGLYLVSTPIGNAADITLRALTILKTAHAIGCEDTRVTGKLCQMYGISTPLFSYHDHNCLRVRPRIIERLKGGEVIAQVTDAGMPGISDPGYKLVEACIQNHIPVTVLPGASAVLTGLVLSGLPTDRFVFGGFLPSKRSTRLATLQEFKEAPGTLIFFEAPHRLIETLEDLETVLGNPPAAVARELTKKFEEVRRGSLQELLSFYNTEGPPKGELLIILGKGEKKEVSDMDIDEALVQALLSHSPRDAASQVALRLGLPRKYVYGRALLLKGQRDS